MSNKPKPRGRRSAPRPTKQTATPPPQVGAHEVVQLVRGLLDDAANAVRSQIPGDDWVPATGSDGELDRANVEIGRKGVAWGPDPAIDMQGFLTLECMVAMDHLIATRYLLVDEGGAFVFAPWTTARAFLEQAALVIWILEPGTVRERVQRSVSLQITGLGDSVNAFAKTTRNTAHQRAIGHHQAVLRKAKDLGFKVDKEGSRMTGMAPAVPGKAVRVSTLLDKAGWPEPGATYTYLSSHAHGEANFLERTGEVEGAGDETVGYVQPRMTAAELIWLTQLLVLAQVTMAREFLTYYGWDATALTNLTMRAKGLGPD